MHSTFNFFSTGKSFPTCREEYCCINVKKNHLICQFMDKKALKELVLWQMSVFGFFFLTNFNLISGPKKKGTGSLMIGAVCLPDSYCVDTIPASSLQDIPLAISVDLGKGMRTVATREKFIKWEVICAAVSGSGSLLCPGGAKCCIPAYGTDQATSGSSEVLIAPDLPLHLYRCAYMLVGVRVYVGVIRFERGHRWLASADRGSVQLPSLTSHSITN